ncbi:MAG: hypothetical protein EON57_03255 [Alphaproteobacteria bacterium]|nr:MAG: hypothetical protein EON57_03255 [Alphaproteobacteria bacterium]
MRDFIGLNTHTVQFKTDLYAPVTSLLRNYHPVAWDLGDDLTKSPAFPMAHNGVDWNGLYGAWKKAGYRTEASAQFESIDPKHWTDIPRQAASYGEAFARFSLPIHRDKPHVVLAHASVAAQIRALPRIAQLFTDASLQPGQMDGVSYGQQLDQFLAAAAKPPVRAQLAPLQLARMVGARRVDFMLIDEEDLGWLRKDPEFTPLPLVRIEFADMPRGELRYLACSPQVSQPTMDRLNQAIRELVPDAQGD